MYDYPVLCLEETPTPTNRKLELCIDRMLDLEAFYHHNLTQSFSCKWNRLKIHKSFSLAYETISGDDEHLLIITDI